jgi:hypothetical protein
VEEYEERKENIQVEPEEIAEVKEHMHSHKEQITILNESTKQNLIKRQNMKSKLFAYYQ